MKRLLLFSLLLSGCPAGAHEDTPIVVSTAGALEGLPEEYQPASLKVAQGSESVTLRIGKNQVVLPKCVAKFFEQPSGEGIAMKASWYHGDFSKLPPYLAVDLPQKSMPKVHDFTGYSLLFNLKTAELIEVEQRIISANTLSTQFIDHEIKEICSKKEQERLKPVRVN